MPASGPGSPMWKSSPKGAATSSAKNRPRMRPVTRRTTSPRIQPYEPRVVAVPGTGLPHRGLGGDGLDHTVPAEHVVHGDLAGHRGQPGLVRQHPPQRDVGLAGGSELRPVGRHRCIEVELARAPRAGARTSRPCPWWSRRRAGSCPVPTASSGPVGVPAPEVHDRAPVVVHAHGGTDVAVLGEVRPERIGDRLEPVVHRAVDLHCCVPHGTDPSCGVTQRVGPPRTSSLVRTGDPQTSPTGRDHWAGPAPAQRRRYGPGRSRAVAIRRPSLDSSGCSSTNAATRSGSDRDSSRSTPSPGRCARNGRR